jgi:predicted ATPase/DNA-binding SARP family transcriptional activator
MARFELFLLGSPRLERDGMPLHFDSRKILGLVAYVAVSGLGSKGGRASRDSLIALLWPELEPSRARAVLRRNLSLLKSALEGEWLVVDRQAVGTDPEADFWLDVDQFTRLVHAWETHGHPQEQVCPHCLQALAEAVALYRGDFLEGFGLRDSLVYDDWQFFQAEGLRQELASALQRLVGGHSSQGNYQAALPYARQWLVLDPLHEPAHRQLMQLFARADQRAAALHQYQECVRILAEELGMAPCEETTALYEQIRAMPPVEPHPLLPRVQGESGGLPFGTALPRHNLPAQATPFVGREEELGDLRDRLNEPACRLLTLLGPGGIGKTRLALRLAQDLIEAEPPSFEHGVFFVSLAPFQTAEGVIPAVAEALGYSFPTDVEGSVRATPRQQLLGYLQRKQLLLVMDNYEQLLLDGTAGSVEGGSDGVGFVTDLLSIAPRVKILVTSRVSLKVRGEYLYPVAGLRVPPGPPARTGDAAAPVPEDGGELLRGYSAVELFVRGAQQVRPGFELRTQDLVHVAHICRLVQGMPLGILLAAAWVEMLTPREIAVEIQRSLDFLETDLRDVPPRQRSIRAVFDHSWQLLGQWEQEMFLGLSVFHRGFTRQAAQEVAGASLRDLMSLVDKSLLLPSSPGRYELHELLRQYGTDRLDLAPEQREAVRDRHCATYCAFLERWARELKGARQQEAAAEMDLDIENGRAAWQWAVAHGQVERLAMSADSIWLYYTWRMRYAEGEEAFRVAANGLETIEAARRDVQRLRAKLLILWSHFQLELGRKDESIETADQAWSLIQEIKQAGQDVRSEEALAVLHKSRIKRYYCADPLEARQSYEQSVALYEKVGDRWGLARALAYLGWMAEHLGRYGEARRLCEKSLAIRQELSDRHGMADAMLDLGVLSWVQGRLDEADGWLRESLGIFWALDDHSRVADAIKSIGEVLVRRGRFVDGLALMESSMEIYDDLAHSFGVSGLFPFFGEAKIHLGRYTEGRADAQQGAERLHQIGHRWGTGFSQFVDGLGALGEGKSREALALLQESANVFGEIRHRENRGWVLGPLGLAAHRAGEPALARQCVAEALQTGSDLGAFMPLMYGLPAAALLLADQGAAERAAEVYAYASRYEFVGSSRWFEDVVGLQIKAAAASVPAKAPEQAQEQGQARDLAEVVAEVLAGW